MVLEEEHQDDEIGQVQLLEVEEIVGIGNLIERSAAVDDAALKEANEAASSDLNGLNDYSAFVGGVIFVYGRDLLLIPIILAIDQDMAFENEENDANGDGWIRLYGEYQEDNEDGDQIINASQAKEFWMQGLLLMGELITNIKKLKIMNYSPAIEIPQTE
ncbi:MAG: hypothetical protein EZS28_007796 [Streblomastix strix]|uniref:Uncharacterized protein n=1 Tax=Streblomastix strix TaxID=222440 RepID=A0A5J4WP27_9EUKA|nr:MAG: hypothetical protein EZS28_007796 [Streblomastix strix]